MPGLEEVLHYLKGVWLLICRKEEGYRFLDFTNQGVARSFWALGLSLPFMFVGWMWARELYLLTPPCPPDPGAILYFRFFMIDMAAWFTPLLLLIGFSILTRLENFFAATVVTTNWLALPFSALIAAIAVLEILFPQASGLWAFLWLFHFIGGFVCLYLLLSTIYQGQTLIAVAVTGIMVVPGFLMAKSLQSFLGIIFH